CFSARAGRPFSGKSNPESRPAGIGLRPLRFGKRRDTLRGISVALRDRRCPAASLDSRRLANFAVAAAARSRRGGSWHPQSDLGVVVVENFRQPAPQPCSDRARTFFPRQLAARSAARLVGNVHAPRHHRAARFAFTRCGTPAQAGAVAVANAFAWNAGVIETDARPDRTYLRILAERCLSQSDSNRPDTLAR